MNRNEIIAVLLLVRNRRLKKKKKRLWVHAIQAARLKYGEYHHLICKDLPADPLMFFQYFRMSVDKFNELLSIVGPTIKKETTNWRATISPRHRLSICLR